MTGEETARKPCSRCGYVEPINDDLPPVAITRPWHIRDRSVLKAYVESLGWETHEWLLALFVDGNLNLLAVDTVARGDLAGVHVNLNAIVSRGYALKADGYILVHNHPSGDPRPGPADIRCTARLNWLSQELDLPLLDHCIVAGDELRSILGPVRVRSGNGCPEPAPAPR